MTMTRRGWALFATLLVLFALWALTVQGDPCDGVADQAACHLQFPER